MSLRVGNCSGFYGDRLSAMREMLDGGDLDVLTGDYLAELTMLILGRGRLKDPSLGYARTFVRQVEDCLGTLLESDVRLVSNAGGLNPAGLALRLDEVAGALGLTPKIAYVDGDDLLDRAAELDFGSPLTANAYLGGFGIAAALSGGADIVVTGRVTDASLVVGPCVAAFGWTPTSYDELAGAVVAGHVLECGTQATGGNFSGFSALPRDKALGFPLADIASDGSSVITKHDGTGGAVTVDTVTAQLVYEIQSTTYLNPDVSVDLSSVALTGLGDDRVGISGVTGSAPPARLKVCLNELGGYRNSGELVLVGLDIEEKAAWVRAQVESALSARRPERVEWSLTRTDVDDAPSEEAASSRLRVSVADADPDVVGKLFTAPLVELALASYPGFTLTAPPSPASPYGVYRAAYVDRAAVQEVAHLPDGSVVSIAEPPVVEESAPLSHPVAPRGFETLPTLSPRHPGVPHDVASGFETLASGHWTLGPTRRVPLGTLVHARSGDKGGDANVGLWVAEAAAHPERVAWLLELATVDRMRALVPEAAECEVEVFRLPNLGAVNVLLHGLLGEGVAASTRFDPQAKGLGEYVRSRLVDVPEALL
jgi:hypothetical protein